MTQATGEAPSVPQGRGARAHRWWREWYEQDRGAMARLRRGDLDLAMFQAATVDLHRRLGGSDTRGFERSALCAAVLAGVREHRAGGRNAFARALGQKTSSDGPAVFSATRAMGLRRALTPAEALPAFRRAVAILGAVTDVDDLAATLLRWFDPSDDRDGRRRVEQQARIDFAFAYHGAGCANPADDKAAPGRIP